MDAMKDALKRRMQESKGPKEMMGEDPQELAVKSGEVAPSLEAEGEVAADPGEAIAEAGTDPALISAAEQAVGPDMMQKILMAIADSGSGGRPGNSLGERAAVGARADLGALKGPMK